MVNRILGRIMLAIVAFLLTVGSAQAQYQLLEENGFDGRLYRLLAHSDDTPITWHESRLACENWGAHLVTIQSRDENNFVAGMLGRANRNHAWIGFTDEPQEGEWVWITGEAVTFTNWDTVYSNEPNGGTRENYGMIFGPGVRFGLWNDANENTDPQEMFVCETNVPALACVGFEPPFENGPVIVKKNRALPLRASLYRLDGSLASDLNLTTSPMIQVVFQPGETSEPVDVTDEALDVGLGTSGNQFAFVGGVWRFNLKTSNYTAPGTYSISLKSGDAAEYSVAGCQVEFVIEE